MMSLRKPRLRCTVPILGLLLWCSCDPYGDGAHGDALDQAAAPDGSLDESSPANAASSAVDARALACAASAPRSARSVSGLLIGAVSWSGVVRVSDDVSLRNAGTSLTIRPGTQVFVDAEREIEIGWNGETHLLDVQGTAEAPVRFCRSHEAGGPWKGLTTGAGVLPSSALRYVVIDGAGLDGDALQLGGGILIDHVWVRDSAGDGVAASDFRADSRDLTVLGSARAPLVLGDAAAVQRLPAGGTFTGNGEDVAQLRFGSVTTATEFRAIGVPYQLNQGLSLRTGGSLRVHAGVEWRVGAGQLIELGSSAAKVELHFAGTAEQPILVRGVEPRAGSWQGMLIQPGVFGTSTLQHLEIRHGGGTSGSALAIHAPLMAADVRLASSAHEALFIDAQGLAAGSARFSVTGTEGRAGRVYPDALTSLPAGGSYRGNQADYIEVPAGNITRAGTIPEIDVPFRVLAGITIRDGAALTIAPGAEFQMESGAVWEAGWNSSVATLSFVGTADKPIRFRGVAERPGSWPGILIQPSVEPTSRLEHVSIGHAGADSIIGANLRLNAPITVSDCTLYGSARYGIVASADYVQDYEGLNTFEANAMGDVERQ